MCGLEEDALWQNRKIYIIFARVKPDTSLSPKHPSLRAMALEMDRSQLRGLNLAKYYIYSYFTAIRAGYSKPHILKASKGCKAARRTR